MSTTRTATHELDIDADTYLHGVYLAEDFTRSLYLDGLSFERYELLSLACTPEGGVERRLRACPMSNAPAVVQKVIGSQEYDEVGSLGPGQRTWRYRVLPRSLPDKLRIQGTQVVAPLGPGRCQVTFECTFEASIFAVGGVVERFMASQFEENVARQLAFTRAWLQRLAP